MVSVKDYGAVGDGVADDTAEIQAAINAASSIYFPTGTYIVSASLTIPSNRMLHGDGAASILKKSAETAGRVLINSDATNGNSGITIESVSTAAAPLQATLLKRTRST